MSLPKISCCQENRPVCEVRGGTLTPHTGDPQIPPLQLSSSHPPRLSCDWGAQLFHGLRIRAGGAGWTGRFQQPFQTSIWFNGTLHGPKQDVQSRLSAGPASHQPAPLAHLCRSSPNSLIMISLFLKKRLAIKGPLKLSAGGTWWGGGGEEGGRWAAELGISTPRDSDTPSATRPWVSHSSASVSRTRGSVSPCLKWRGRCDYQVNDNMSGTPSWREYILGDPRMSPLAPGPWGS